LVPLTELEVFRDPLRLTVTDAVQSANKYGANLRLVPGKTGIYYFEKLQYDSPYGRQAGRGGTSTWTRKLKRIFTPLTTFWGVLDITLAISIPTLTEGLIREQTVSAELSLARMALATRIRELEGQGRTGNTAELTPDLLPEDPVDPFSDQAYLWSASDRVFYSVGPDKVSQDNRLRYSPTNGTVSTGDISLP
jgi:hypothetical protein